MISLMVHKDDQAQVTICPEMSGMCGVDIPDQRLLLSQDDCWCCTNQSQHSHFLIQQVTQLSQCLLGRDHFCTFLHSCSCDDKLAQTV